MPDTSFGGDNYGECSDCGDEATCSHWGPLAPLGEVWRFCEHCFGWRRHEHDEHDGGGEEFSPKPLGHTWPEQDPPQAS